jgi:hypothetical protein
MSLTEEEKNNLKNDGGFTDIQIYYLSNNNLDYTVIKDLQHAIIKEFGERPFSVTNNDVMIVVVNAVNNADNPNEQLRTLINSSIGGKRKRSRGGKRKRILQKTKRLKRKNKRKTKKD